MVKAKKSPTVSKYRIFYTLIDKGGKKNHTTVGYITSTSPKKALASFLQGKGKCLIKSALQNESIRKILKANKKRLNFTIFIWIDDANGNKVEAVAGHIHAYSAKQALSGFKKNQGRNKLPGVLQIAIIHNNLHVRLA